MLLSISPQFINLRFISKKGAFHMMLKTCGMICHWIFKLLLHFNVSKGDLNPICFRSLSHISFSKYRTLMVNKVMTRQSFVHYDLDGVH